MNFDRLLAAGVNEHSPLMLGKVICRGLQPSRMCTTLLRPILGSGAEMSGEVAQGGDDFILTQRKPVVRFGTEQRRRAFDRVDAAHGAAGFGGAARRRELPC